MHFGHQDGAEIWHRICRGRRGTEGTHGFCDQFISKLHHFLTITDIGVQLWNVEKRRRNLCKLSGVFLAGFHASLDYRGVSDLELVHDREYLIYGPYVKEQLIYKKMCIYALSITQNLLIESNILR